MAFFSDKNKLIKHTTFISIAKYKKFILKILYTIFMRHAMYNDNT